MFKYQNTIELHSYKENIEDGSEDENNLIFPSFPSQYSIVRKFINLYRWYNRLITSQERKIICNVSSHFQILFTRSLFFAIVLLWHKKTDIISIILGAEAPILYLAVNARSSMGF